MRDQNKFQRHLTKIFWLLGPIWSSIALHLLIFFGLFTINTLFPKLFEGPKEKKMFVLDNINPIQLKKIRNLGIKNGSKVNSTYVPLSKNIVKDAKTEIPGGSRTVRRQGQQQQRQMKRSIQVPPSKNSDEKSIDGKKLSLSQLKVGKNEALILPKQRTRKRERRRGKVQDQPRRDVLQMGNEQVQKIYREEIAGQSAALSRAQKDSLLNYAQANIQVEIPEGVSEDELNRFELTFYAFRKRIAVKYISSVYHTARSYQMANPQVDLSKTPPQELRGKVTFGRDGKIVAIKIIQEGKTQEIQNLFVKALENMQGLLNPPKELVKHGEFSIYYSLIISG